MNLSAINCAGLSAEQFVGGYRIRIGKKRSKYAGPVKFFSSSFNECMFGKSKIGSIYQLALALNNFSKGSDEIT